ncbi:hypothetical protein ABPG74_003116 [Tetrahymena malaccensis]
MQFQQTQGIIQCKKCLNFISITNKIQSIYVIDEVKFISLEGSISSVIKSEQKFITEQNQDSSNTLTELCVYEMFLCRNCKSEIGRMYIATTEAYDLIRMKFLLFEDCIQCQDAYSCEQFDLNQIFKENIVLSASKNILNQQLSSSNKKNINYLSREMVDQKQINKTTNSSQFKVKKESESQNNEEIKESINHINQAVKTFEASLNSFDERIGDSEAQLEYLSNKVVELLKISTEIQNQRVYQNQNYSQNKQDLNSTPYQRRNQIEIFSQSNHSRNPSYGYKSDKQTD